VRVKHKKATAQPKSAR